MQAADVLIVGGGIAGLSTAWNLSRGGQTGILLLEREAELGSHASAQNASILKELAHDAHSAELARRGAAFLRNPPDGFADGPLVDECGLWLVADEASEARFDAALDAAHGIEFERLSRAEIPRRLPFYRSPLTRAARFPRDGRIHVRRLLEAYARGARRAGVEIRTSCEVTGLLREGGRVAGVQLADGNAMEARMTVLATGAWAGVMARRAGSRLEFQPRRRHLLVSAGEAGPRDDLGILWRLDESFYARPERGGWLACACDETDVAPEPLTTVPHMRTEILGAARRALAAFPEGEPQDFWCGLRTFTPDGRFAIGPDPDLTGLFWVAGLGGAGMGTGPEVGRVAAELLGDKPAHAAWVRALDPGRFLGTAVGG